MKSVGALLLSTYFVFAGMLPRSNLCCELPKLQNLIAHYNDHNNRDALGFFEFFALHYGFDGIDHSDGSQEHDDHDKLPFKNIDVRCPGSVFIPTYNISFEMPEPITLKKTLFKYFEPFSSEYIDPILHPPKV